MTWLKVDDKLTFHAKIIRAKNAAVGAWVRMGAWCAERESDGFIPSDIVELIASPAEIAKLLEVELLHARLDGMYELHDYLKYNPSKSQLIAQRAEWAARRGADRRKPSRVASHSDTPSDTRECLAERPAETPGTGSGSEVRDPESDPDGVSHHEVKPAKRLASVPPPPPPEPRDDTGYSLAKRVFSEEWRAKKGRDYVWSSRTGKFSDDVAMLETGRHARVGADAARAEVRMRHWAKAYVRDAKATISDEGHPARFLTPDVANKYGEPPAAKSLTKLRAAAPAEPVAPALSVEQQGQRAAEAMKAMGKIGMGGRT